MNRVIFNPDIMMSKIHESDIYSTKNFPHTYHEFPLLNIDLNKLNNDIINKCSEDCRAIYRENKTSTIRDSVDINPRAWTNIFIFHMIKPNRSNSVFKVPNGCNANDKNNLEYFYKIIYNYIKKTLLNIDYKKN